jgi:hypothetical protein
VHSEFYFTDVLWPAFRKVDFLRAIRAYQARNRRFGRWRKVARNDRRSEFAAIGIITNAWSAHGTVRDGRRMSLLFALYTEPIYFFQQTVKREASLELNSAPCLRTHPRSDGLRHRAPVFSLLLQNFPVSRQATVVLLQHSKNFEAAPHCRANWLLGCYRLANSGACHDHR